MAGFEIWNSEAIMDRLNAAGFDPWSVQGTRDAH
jgi:hypothetical protein